MAAPPMIAALPVAGEGAAEVAGGEGRDVFREAQLLHRTLECQHRLAQLGQKVRMRTDGGLTWSRSLVGVQIVTTYLAEKDLSPHAESAGGRATVARLNQTRGHLQLWSQR